MAYINITLIRKRPSPILIILDQLMIVSCDDIITLSATVPASINPQSYFWEQLSGQTVIWLTPTNELEATFQQTLVRDDKVFRFWVNKGGTKEAYKDIIVTAIPRDYIPEIKHARNFTQTYADEEVARAYMIPGLSSEDTWTINNTDRGIRWPAPTVTIPAALGGYSYNQANIQFPVGAEHPVGFKNYIEKFKVYDVTGGAEVEIDEIDPAQDAIGSLPARGYFNVPRLRSYRVDTVINRNGMRHVAKGIPSGFYPPANWLDADTLERGPVHATAATLSVVTNRNQYVTITQFAPDDTAEVHLLSKALPVYNTYIRYPLTRIVNPPEDSDAFVHTLSATSSVTVSRLDLGIGGIGG